MGDCNNALSQELMSPQMVEDLALDLYVCSQAFLERYSTNVTCK